MASQIFKEHIPNELLFGLMDKIAIKTDKCYVVDKSSYKRGLFNESIVEFRYNLSKKEWIPIRVREDKTRIFNKGILSVNL